MITMNNRNSIMLTVLFLAVLGWLAATEPIVRYITAGLVLLTASITCAGYCYVKLEEMRTTKAKFKFLLNDNLVIVNP